MAYGQTRDSEQLRILSQAIGQFIGRYNANPSNANRQTVILFPGAMGSQLKRATSAYKKAPGSPRTFNYDFVWLNPLTFLGAALKLGLKWDNAEQTFLDAQNRIIIADGPVDILGLVQPYGGLIQWCQTNQLDWFVFGWDWRRRLEEIADFFVQQFLLQFQTMVKQGCNNADPLANLTLIGHSSGGLVVDLVLQRYPQVTRAISVATPFYGTPSQLHRYFEGERFLDYFGKKKIAKLISSMPGGYTLLFLDDNVTYGAVGPALKLDPYPLDDYPSLDASTAAVADPYNPTTNGALVRYPTKTKTGFDKGELGHGDGICQQVTGGLTAAQQAKFINIRGVRSTDATAITQTWGWIPTSFDPDTANTPITDSAIGPGDDVVPAWSARLVGLPPNNIKTLTGVDNHVFLMNDPQTLQKLGQIILGGPSIMARRFDIEPAGSKEARDFVRNLQKKFASRTKLKPAALAELQEYLDQFPQGKLRSIFARVMIDLARGPSAPEPRRKKTRAKLKAPTARRPKRRRRKGR